MAFGHFFLFRQLQVPLVFLFSNGLVATFSEIYEMAAL
ncbi:exclusion suppressor FxsA [Listeria monocytogenes]|nr:exclusion suppressor FxsA [Listeria monocytogenes]GAT41835.1 exclusion suppressor FxsA [Listeria monocytogenes]